MNILHRLLRIRRTLSPAIAFECWAPSYDEKDSNPLLMIEEKFFSPYLQSLEVRGKHVIDFGCGTGRYVRNLIDLGAASITGIDQSQSMLAIAKEKVGATLKTRFIYSSIEALPLEDASYDVGICNLTLSYSTNLKRAVGEMCRVLRPHATLLVSDLHPIQKSLRWKRTFTSSQSDQSSITYNIQHHDYSLEDYIESFEKNYFVIDKMSEPQIDTSILSVFEKFNMREAFNRYCGTPILFIFKLHKI